MGWVEGGVVERAPLSHCKWYANDITANSRNNVIFFYKQKIPISPFVQPPFDIPLFIDCFTSLPL